tara:strand:- start:1254 stop:1451 length:198 start_codon:yes stop_codon:yes gene_type:complete
MIDIKTIEEKLETLKKNKDKVMEQIKQGQDIVRQANADLNAIQGAMQVCEQLIEDNKETENDPKN